MWWFATAAAFSVWLALAWGLAVLIGRVVRNRDRWG
jgi:hypothetical protein